MVLDIAECSTWQTRSRINEASMLPTLHAVSKQLEIRGTSANLLRKLTVLVAVVSFAVVSFAVGSFAEIVVAVISFDVYRLSR